MPLKPNDRVKFSESFLQREVEPTIVAKGVVKLLFGIEPGNYDPNLRNKKLLAWSGTIKFLSVDDPDSPVICTPNLWMQPNTHFTCDGINDLIKEHESYDISNAGNVPLT